MVVGWNDGPVRVESGTVAGIVRVSGLLTLRAMTSLRTKDLLYSGQLATNRVQSLLGALLHLTLELRGNELVEKSDVTTVRQWVVLTVLHTQKRVLVGVQPHRRLSANAPLDPTLVMTVVGCHNTSELESSPMGIFFVRHCSRLRLVRAFAHFGRSLLPFCIISLELLVFVKRIFEEVNLI